jgi:hypothetical protein
LAKGLGKKLGQLKINSEGKVSLQSEESGIKIDNGVVTISGKTVNITAKEININAASVNINGFVKINGVSVFNLKDCVHNAKMDINQGGDLSSYTPLDKVEESKDSID